MMSYYTHPVVHDDGDDADGVIPCGGLVKVEDHHHCTICSSGLVAKLSPCVGKVETLIKKIRTNVFVT